MSHKYRATRNCGNTIVGIVAAKDDGAGIRFYETVATRENGIESGSPSGAHINRTV